MEFLSQAAKLGYLITFPERCGNVMLNIELTESTAHIEYIDSIYYGDVVYMQLAQRLES